MKYPVCIILSFIFICIVSCDRSGSEITYPPLSPEKVFVKDNRLQGEYLSDSILNPYTLFHTQHGLIYVMSKGNYELLHMVDTLTAKEIATCGRRGRGPGEFMGFLPYYYDWDKHRLYAADVYKQQLWSFLISDKGIEQCGFSKLNRDIKALATLNDSTFVFLTFFPYQTFGIMTKTCRELTSMPYRIIDREDIDYGKFAFSCALYLTPDKSKAVIIGSTYASLRIYTLTGNKPELVCNYPFFEHHYDLADEQPYAQDRNLRGREASCITDNYVYIASYGKTVGEEVPATETYILVFNMKGEYVKTYYIDKKICSMVVPRGDRVLYATVDDPEVYIVKFRL